MRTDTNVLIEALLIVANDMQSADGVANSCIREGAERIRELQGDLDKLIKDARQINHTVRLIKKSKEL